MKSIIFFLTLHLINKRLTYQSTQLRSYYQVKSSLKYSETSSKVPEVKVLILVFSYLIILRDAGYILVIFMTIDQQTYPFLLRMRLFAPIKILFKLIYFLNPSLKFEN